MKRQVLVSTLIPDPEIPAETQALFQVYSAFGQKQNTTRLGVNNWVKCCKESPDLIKPKIVTQQDCELIFKKALAGSNESHLHYAEFLVALRLVAEARLKSAASKWGFRLVGADARLVRLLQEFVFKSPPGLKLGKTLKSQAAPRRADAHIRTMVCRIQTCYRGYAGRCRSLEARAVSAHYQEMSNQFEAALLFQRFWHRHKAKKKAITAAKLIWEKYIDSVSGKSYYYNRRTGTTMWTKPPVLGADDIGSAVRIAAGDVFTITCASCAENLATSFCLDCAELHCESCSTILHGKKNS